MTIPTLHLICGLPGTGKTTLARELETNGAGVWLNPDEWMLALDFDIHDEPARERVEALQWQLGQTLLGHGTPVILDNGFWTRTERDGYRGRARELGATVRLYPLSAPIEELRRRIRARNAAMPAEWMDLTDLALWASLYEEPTVEELALYDGH